MPIAREPNDRGLPKFNRPWRVRSCALTLGIKSKISGNLLKFPTLLVSIASVYDSRPTGSLGPRVDIKYYSIELAILYEKGFGRMHFSFAGKTALVTGSSKGIGRAVAVELASGGANVTVNYSSSKGEAEETAALVEQAGGKALVVGCDVSDQAAVEDMVAQTVKKFGGLDIFVSNAVYSDRQLMIEADMKGFKRTVDVSMWGAFFGLRASAQQMVKQGRGGAICVISSPHAVIPFPTAMAYNMCKAAIDHMARTAAIELVKSGIRVNVFHPGWIDTPGERKFFSEEQLQEGGRQMPLGRLGTAEEMAFGVCFTLSEQGSYMTGSTMTMDGGVQLPWWSKRTEGGQ
jgi:glucose 1-dehydrogenase